jgi:hypothetical protein
MSGSAAEVVPSPGTLHPANLQHPRPVIILARRSEEPASQRPEPAEEGTNMELRNTETVTLAKALSVKNRLAGRLSQARSNIETYNSVLAGQRDEQNRATVDVRAEYERLLMLQEGIIAVKAAIQRANAVVYEDVLRLAEKKALVQMLSNLNTKHGSEPGFNGVEYRYLATILKPEALEMVRRLEAEIDKLQDRLNQYNANTTVEVPTAVLDLAR